MGLVRLLLMLDFTPGGQILPPGGGDPDQTNGITDPTVPYSTAKPVVDRDGCKVQIIHKTVSVYDANGKLLRQESIVGLYERKYYW